MDAHYMFVEFYITCNPPLLSRGVKHIIESAKSACQKGELAEILYEPDIPWFKCITSVGYQALVTGIIQDLLLQLVEMEVGPLDFDPLEDNIGDGILHSDVVMKASEPRMIPWAMYKSLGSEIYDTFVDYRFPDTMASLPFKAVWRGLQNSSGASVESLLSAFRSLSKTENVPITAHDFALSNNCQISYNMRENLVYIGCYESIATVDKTVRKLEAMLNLLASKIKVTSHHILPEGPDALKITYRWLSHTGLHKATFAVRSSNVAISDEYKLLLNAAVIRTEKKDKHDRWIPDNTVYPLKGVPQLEAGQTFNAFKGYVPRPKARFVKLQALPYMHRSQHVKEETGSSLDEAEGSKSFRGPVQTDPEISYTPVIDNLGLNSSELSMGGYGVTSNRELRDDCGLFAYQQPSISNNPSPKLNAVDATVAESMQRWRISETSTLNASQQSSIEDYLIDLEEAVESPAQSEFVMADHRQEEPLISFAESGEESPCGSENFGSMHQSTIMELRKVQEEIMRRKQFEHSDDLIWLDDGSQAQKPPPGVGILEIFDDGPANASLQGGKASDAESGLSTVVVGKNPLEAQDQSSMGMYSGGLVRFGLMAERPRELFQTMNQKGGRAITKPTKGYRSPGGASVNVHQTSVTRSQRIQVSAARGHLNPTTPTRPRPNAEFEAAFPPLAGAPPSPRKQMKKPLLYCDAAKFPNSRDAAIGQATKGPARFPELNGVNDQLRPVSTEAMASTSEAGRNLSKEPRLKDPHEEVVYASPEKSDILRDMEDQLKTMSQILELAPGYVSLEVVFGRIYIKQMAPSLVNSGSGLSSSVNEAVEFLNAPSFRQGCVGFSPILSTLGGDADILANITPPGESPWHLFEKEVWYDFECKLPGYKNESFVVELNADSFQYRCRGPRQEIFTIYMHCPQRAWDMKACGVRSTALGTEARFRCFVASLVENMAVFVDGKGDMRIEFPDDIGLQADIENISMRQIARYHHGKEDGNSVLSITMTHVLEESVSTVDTNQAIRGEGKKRFACPKGSWNSAIPNQYLEASITSSRLLPYLQENIDFECGDKATWDTSHLESAGVFEDILRPALGMITHMDPIGSSNNTMRGVNDQDAFHEALVESDAMKKKKYTFW
ncbi:hypothetical protein V8C37DRAFT_383033 [Trichoderma ceciliae]